MTNLKPCKGKDEAKLAAKARTACLTQMRACNSYVELAGRLQYTCKYTADDLKKTLAQITANNATVAAAMAKVKALTGVEATDNSSSSNSSRRARAAHDEEENIAPIDELPGPSWWKTRDPNQTGNLYLCQHDNCSSDLHHCSIFDTIWDDCDQLVHN